MPKPYLIRLLLLSFIWFTPGCMTTRLIGNYSSDNIITHQKTTYSLAWGLLQPKDILTECESKAICKVTSQTNLGFILLSAATLGLVVPQKVTWNCCPSVVPEDKLNTP